MSIEDDCGATAAALEARSRSRRAVKVRTRRWSPAQRSLRFWKRIRRSGYWGEGTRAHGKKGLGCRIGGNKGEKREGNSWAGCARLWRRWTDLAGASSPQLWVYQPDLHRPYPASSGSLSSQGRPSWCTAVRCSTSSAASPSPPRSRFATSPSTRRPRHPRGGPLLRSGVGGHHLWRRRWRRGVGVGVCHGERRD